MSKKIIVLVMIGIFMLSLVEAQGIYPGFKYDNYNSFSNANYNGFKYDNGISRSPIAWQRMRSGEDYSRENLPKPIGQRVIYVNGVIQTSEDSDPCYYTVAGSICRGKHEVELGYWMFSDVVRTSTGQRM